MRKDLVVLPQSRRLGAVILGEIHPCNPGRIPGYVVNFPHKQRCEVILDNPCPNAILVFFVQADQFFVKSNVRVGGGDVQPFVMATGKKFVGRVSVLHALFQHIGILGHFLGALGNFFGYQQVWRLHGAARDLGNVSEAGTCKQVAIFRRRHYGIAQINWNFHTINVANQVLDSHEVVRPGGHYR